MQPGRFGLEIDLLREMGWSWAELQDTPAALIDELIVRISAERSYTDKRRKLDEQMRKQK